MAELVKAYAMVAVLVLALDAQDRLQVIPLLETEIEELLAQ